MRKIVALFLALVMSGNALAQQVFQICEKQRFNIIYSNGIQNHDLQMNRAVQHIKLNFASQFNAGEVADVSAVWHQPDGLGGDLAEVFVQKVNEARFASRPFSEKVRAWFELRNNIGSDLEPLFQEWAKQVSAVELEQIVKDRLPSAKERVAQEAERDYRLVAGKLENGGKVLIIAHSQGNLAANIIYEGLMAGPLKNAAIERLGLVAVASAAGITYDDGAAITNGINYLTVTDDKVIGLLRASQIAGLLPPLPAVLDSIAVTQPHLAKDPFSHSFVDTYANPDDVGVFNYMSGMIKSQGDKLLGKEVAFTTTLYSENQPDYDLNGLPFPRPVSPFVYPSGNQMIYVSGKPFLQYTYASAGYDPQTDGSNYVHSYKITAKYYCSGIIAGGESQLPLMIGYYTGVDKATFAVSVAGTDVFPPVPLAVTPRYQSGQVITGEFGRAVLTPSGIGSGLNFTVDSFI